MESHIKPPDHPPNSLEGSIPSARSPYEIRDSACSVTNSVTKPLKYLSICSGIEAATVAWHGLGWLPVGFSEIESFPSAVLAHHWQDVPKLGDMTKFYEWPTDLKPDIIVGGTPCQAFSVAGLRKGLADPRGNLTLTFLSIVARYRPRWICWENVPGVLSDKSGAFGSFLGGLAELGYGWAYRILDAQYFGVPQRRRRVFVVGCAGDWTRAAAVLFERESLLRNPPPSREARKGIAYDVAPCINASGRGFERTGDPRGQDCLIPEVNSRLCPKCGQPTQCIALFDDGGQSYRCAGGHIFDNVAIQEIAGSLGSRGTRSHTEIDGHGAYIPEIAGCLQERDYKGCDSDTKPGHLIPVVATIDSSYGRLQGCSGQDSNHGHSHLIPIHTTGPGFWREGFGALRAREQDSHENLVAYRTSGNCGAYQTGDKTDALTTSTDTTSHILAAQPIAFSGRARGDDGRGYDRPPQVFGSDIVGTIDTVKPHCVAGPICAVRRLTPTECERLQGFPDDHTRIPWRNKPAEQCPDGPRYKAIGNSMAVPCMAWIGKRIQLIDSIKP